MAPAASKAIRDQLKKLRFRLANMDACDCTALLTWEELGDRCVNEPYTPNLRLWLPSSRDAVCSDSMARELPCGLDAVEGVAPLPNLSAMAPIFGRDLLPKVRRERRCALHRSVRVRKR